MLTTCNAVPGFLGEFASIDGAGPEAIAAAWRLVVWVNTWRLEDGDVIRLPFGDRTTRELFFACHADLAAWLAANADDLVCAVHGPQG